MRAQDIRRTFVEFFRARDHRVWPSSSLIPNDPTLLLTVAGMVQFEPYFRGEASAGPPARGHACRRSPGPTTSRTSGHTTRHLTFFEMLGNFSFGDYFKREAIRWAWELATTPGRRGRLRLPARAHLGDDLSRRRRGRAAVAGGERPARRRASCAAARPDNFWSTGRPGPCGPCSELYSTAAPSTAPRAAPPWTSSRYLEFWNLVFMQFETADGSPGSNSEARRRCRSRTSTPAWAWSAWRCCCRTCRTSSRPTSCGRCSTRAVELTGVRYGADATATSACA